MLLLHSCVLVSTVAQALLISIADLNILSASEAVLKVAIAVLAALHLSMHYATFSLIAHQWAAIHHEIYTSALEFLSDAEAILSFN